MSKVRRVWYIDPPIADAIRQIAEGVNRPESRVVNAILFAYIDKGAENE